MNGLFNPEVVTKLLLDFELYSVILSIIELQTDLTQRQLFVSYAFVNAFAQEKFSFAVRLQLDY